MEHTDPYIKLSKIRDDYGIANRQGTDFYMSELDNLSSDQLKSMRNALIDEVDDIIYQISYEREHLEKGSRWMYGAKHSRDARKAFINRINELLGDHLTDEQLALKFMDIAKQTYGNIYESILSEAKGESSEVSLVKDMD